MLILQLAIHYIIYWVFVVFFHPEREWSLGLHEPVGPCNEVATLTTPFGQVREASDVLQTYAFRILTNIISAKVCECFYECL